MDSTRGSDSKRVLIRVKRRRSDSPVQALLLNAKRRRRDDEVDASGASASPTSDGVKKVFAFAGSVGPGERTAVDALLDKLKEPEPSKSLGAKRSTGTPKRKGIKERTKDEKADKAARQKLNASSSRFTVVQAKRNIKVSELIPDAVHLEEAYDVVTVEPAEKSLDPSGDAIACNNEPLVASARDDLHYTYDYYYSYGKELKFEDIDGEILGCDMKSVEQFLREPELQYDSESDSEAPRWWGKDDSEDSNAEDNWRNDYPDELSDDDEEFYNGFDDYRRRDYEDEVVSCSSSNEESCRPVDDEDDLVYSIRDDADRHGSAYAKFKRQMMRDFRGLKVDGGPDESWEDDVEDDDDRDCSK